MSLSITINNINDLTDAEREVLRYITGDVNITGVFTIAGGPSVTKQHIESLADDEDTVIDGITRSEHAPVSHAVAPTPASATAGTSAELDTNGLPWDKRIHASTRSKVADGRWKYARGVHPALITEVEAELRAVQTIPVPTPPVVEAAGGVVVIAIPSPSLDNRRGVGGVVAHVPVPPAPPAPIQSSRIDDETRGKLFKVLDDMATGALPEPITAVDEFPPVPPVQVTPAPAMTFADLMKHVTPMLVSGKLPQDTLLAVTAEFGLPHLAALGARPDLVEAVRARIDEVVGGVV